MKKKLESELISLAHRVLKLTGREDLKKMQEEVALLYQKITILKFFQDQFKGEIPEELEAKTSFFSSLDGAFNNKVSDSVEIDEKVYVNIDNNEQEAIMEPAIEKIKDIVAQMPQEANAVDDLFEEINSNKKAEELEELTENYGQLPMFDPVNGDNPEKNEEPLSELKKVSVDQNLKSGGFEIGLNDRLAFVNHLFENNNEDYDRVISQLTTMDSFEEISDFIENIIKPDYNNWEGKSDYESRFLEIIEQKFI
jgi:broad-specificity NMP kinase